MSACAVVYIANQNTNLNLSKIRKHYHDSDIFVCPIGDVLYTAESNIILPEKLVGSRYNDYIFCLSTEEVICFIALKAADFLIHSYKTVIIISDREQFPEIPDDENTFKVFPNVLHKADRNGMIDFFSLPIPLYCNDSFALNKGTAIAEFLKWSQKKYDRILFNGLGDRSFLKGWLSYASLFGCQIDFSKEGVSLYFSENNNRYFKDNIPVANVLRKYYGLDYRLRNKCKGQPLEHPDYFMKDSIIIGDSQKVPVTAIEKAIYEERPDLQAAFPDLNDSEIRIRFTEWFLQYAKKEYRLPDEYIAPIQALYQAHVQMEEEKNRERSRRKSLFPKYGKKQIKMMDIQYPLGVNLCGFIKGDFGLGESIRILARILEHTKIPYTVIEVQDLGLHTFTNTEFENKISNEFIYNTNIFAYNPDFFEESVKGFDKSVFHSRHNIGYWAWEMPEFPPGWENAFPYFKEIWTLSDFTRQAIMQQSPIPVRVVPYAIHPQKDTTLTRASFDLPENNFIFLMTYDTRSISERKNPMAAVRAFLKAFGGKKDVLLLLKLNAPLNWNGDKALMELLKVHSNIRAISEQMSKEKINSLISLCDAYVSLHRSEGFGLGPAEAMAFGKPVVITNYSGNTQYMREGACCPVPYRIVELKENFGIYQKGMHWAEPDETIAAEFMKKLVEDREYCCSIGNNAKKVIETEFSYARCGEILEECIAKLK